MSGWQAAAVLVGTALAIVATAWVLARIVRRVVRGRVEEPLALLHRHCQRAVVACAVTIVWLLELPSTRLRPGTTEWLHHAFLLALIGALAWLFVKALFVGQDITFARMRIDVADNRRARRVRTQVGILRSLTAVTVTLIAIAAMLMTFTRLRTLGASLLASAGLAGLVAGVASQTALRNVFAGLQLAFTDSLRLDDVVVVEDEWGRVEQLTLMTVTLHLWDERRLILPTSYFTTTPFQNWTRTEARVLGAVEIHVDFCAPIDAMRRQTYEILTNSPLWDRREWVLQVIDATPATMVVRILASAADAPSAFDLRCDIREQLLGWLAETYPDALPRVRLTNPGGAGSRALVAPDGSSLLDRELDSA